MYITYKPDGSIKEASTFGFPMSVHTDKTIVRGWEGSLYFEGDPRIEKPQSVIESERKTAIRYERDQRIAETDYLMTVDYPMTEEQREPWKVYRQALRDLPTQPGFPWSGCNTGDTKCPWPKKPEMKA